MKHTFERVPLYIEVWSTPLTRLGEKYRLSDNGMRKICKAMNIPLPPAGHWAKIAAGAIVPRVPLPPSAERTSFTSHPHEKGYPAAEDDADRLWLSQREAFENEPENKIVVNENVTRWHPILRGIRTQVIAMVKKSAKQKREWERHQALTPARRAATHNVGASAWTQFDAEGQFLELGWRYFPLRVTLRTWERALNILQTLFEAAESRGLSIKQEGEKVQLVFSLDGAEVRFRMSERVEDTNRKLKQSTALDELLGSRFIKAPTGELRVFLSAHGSEMKIDESVDKPLETQLNALLIRLFRKIVSVKRKEREWAEIHRRHAREALARAELEAKRQEALRIAAEENARRKELLHEAKAWRDANLLRSYLAAVKSCAVEREAATSQNMAQWLDWAQQVADEIDPIAVRIS